MPLCHVVPWLVRSAQLAVSLVPKRSEHTRLAFSRFCRVFPFKTVAMSLSSAAAVAMGDSSVIGDGLKPSVVFVLGAPGCGKGTQCPLIVRDFGYVHLSAGDLLREERESKDSPYGELILNYMKEGKIVPVEITCSLLENAMRKSGRSHFLIDGFPRNQNNLEGWNRQMGHKTNLLFVLHLDAPKELCVQRCLKRGAQSGRPDDNLDSLGKRFDTYMNDTMPIINFYAERGLVRKVSTVPPPEEVHRELTGIFKAAEKAEGDRASAGAV
ncbi:UMP-CMP kinase-like [Paramacrobiotus metropolitanus]|uniref:UMP-CMP kinase-like n=1 Tax=Paramacrobiotus metropolitanus TaxID=2943436 RepID=UPI0024463490|nr:UMP-CMP kinase-like [Paramacrobiotus metropolitanus]